MATVRPPRKLASDALWEYALRTLGSRAHSAAELKRKLLRRAQSSSDVTATLRKLGEYGLLDDRKFSEAYAAARLASEGHGRFRVLRDLRSKQIASAVADRAVTAAFQGTDENQLAEAFLLRKYRAKNLPLFLAEEKNLASAYRRLRTAGFSSGATWSALRKYNQQAEEWVEEPEESAD